MILAVDMEICLLPSRDMILEIESDRRNLRVRKASRYAIFAKKFCRGFLWVPSQLPPKGRKGFCQGLSALFLLVRIIHKGFLEMVSD